VSVLLASIREVFCCSRDRSRDATQVVTTCTLLETVPRANRIQHHAEITVAFSCKYTLAVHTSITTLDN
jgi:hypothetical protein